MYLNFSALLVSNRPLLPNVGYVLFGGAIPDMLFGGAALLFDGASLLFDGDAQLAG